LVHENTKTTIIQAFFARNISALRRQYGGKDCIVAVIAN